MILLRKIMINLLRFTGHYSWYISNITQTQVVSSTQKLKIAMLMGIFFLFKMQSLQAQVPFTCDPTNTGLLARGQDTRLDEISLINGSQIPVIPGVAGQRYNAIGYNVIDNLIYGMVNIPSTSSNQLIRLQADGTTNIFPAISDPNFPFGNYLAGDVDINGIYHVKAQNSTNINRIDLTTVPPTILTPLSLPSPAPRVSDMAFSPIDGNLYGVLSQPFGVNPVGTMVRFILSGTPSFVIMNTTLPVITGSYGALFFASDGTMYGYRNGSVIVPLVPGALYQVSDPSLNNSPTFSLIRDNIPAVQGNDGARCPFALTVDYSDAPESYGTSSAANGPTHGITSTLYLGINQPDINIDGVPGTQANGDDGDIIDDEDGVLSFPTMGINPGDTYSVPNIAVHNSLGQRARLCGWIDFDINGQTGDGSFENTSPGDGVSERACVTVDGTPQAGEDPDNGSCTGMAPDFICQLDFTAPNDFVFKNNENSFARFRLTTDAAFFTINSPSPNGAAANGEVEDFLVPANILPVTLSSFDSAQSGNYINFDWGTSSELFNVGFQLWGLDGTDGQWEKLHNWLVKSGSGNAVEPQSYSKRVRIPGSIDQLVSVGLSNVDSDGSEHYFGPFNVGQSYGELNSHEPIAWDDIRAELDARMSAQGYVRDRFKRYHQVSAGTSSAGLSNDTDSVVEFNVSEEGMYRVRSADLLNAGIDWSQVRSGDIALVNAQGNAVVRYVVAKGAGNGLNKTLGSGGELYFYGQVPSEQAGLYTESSVYRLVLDRYQALQAAMQPKQGIKSGLNTTYVELSEIEVDKTYVLNSELDDPWVDRVVVGYSDQAGLYTALIPVEADAQLDAGSVIHLQAGRSSGLSAVDDDGDGVVDTEHIAQGLILSGGALAVTGLETASGSGSWDLAFTIAPQVVLDRQPNGDVLIGGSFSAGVGYAFSEVQIDTIGLSYTRPLVSKAGDDHLSFTGGDDNAIGYEVVVPDTGWPWVFASDGTNLVRLRLEGQSKQTSPSGDKQRRVRVSVLQGHELSDRDVHYWVSGKPGYLSVVGLNEKTIVSQSSLLTQAQGNEYLFIAHPTFMGAATDGVDYLSLYADHKRDLGHTVSVINYLDVVQAYGGGQAGPHGLTAYLNAVEGQGTNIESVLIVGGSVYDHTDILQAGAVTFIPGHYGASNYSNYTVSDYPYVSDGSGGAFASIGRWPVRSMADLGTIVTKSMTWADTKHSGGSALLIAEHTVDGENIDFGRALDGVSTSLPADYTQRRVYVDQILAADPSLSLTEALAQAKTEIIDELSTGASDVVMYNGHASTRQLSNQNLFKASDVADVKGGEGQIWVPLSCYVTYYESTHVDTLAHQLLFSGNAVNITGAMLLSDQGENIQMGTSIIDGVMNNGQGLGSAVDQAKAVQANPSLNINWATLGDPTSLF